MRLPAGLRLLRPHQWVKNLFVLAPALFAGRITESTDLYRSAAAAGLFCLISSAVYIFNDIRDRESDARHKNKSRRPVASGEISVPAAGVTAAFLCIAALAASVLLTPMLSLLIILYIAINVGYSLGLKNIALLDVMIISGGFIIRLYAGAVVLEVGLSNWILLTTFFLTIFLGFTKRWSEIHWNPEGEGRKSLKGYTPRMLEIFIAMSAVLAISSYSLYVVNHEAMGGRGGSDLLFTIPLVVVGLMRYMMTLFRDDNDGDVAEMIFKDPFLFIVVGLWIAVTGYLYITA